MGVIAAIVLGALLPAAAQGMGQQASARPAPLHPLALGSGVERDTRLTNRLRLRVTTVATAAGPREKMRERVGGSMIDLYPSEASGFHLSAGTRIYDTRLAEQGNRGPAGAPRQSNIPGGRVALRRTPALTMGYSDAISDRLHVGVEAGAMLGRAYNTATDQTRRLRGERDGGDPVNPVVQLVIGRRF